jgi:hypothetical protein
VLLASGGLSRVARSRRRDGQRQQSTGNSEKFPSPKENILSLSGDFSRVDKDDTPSRPSGAASVTPKLHPCMSRSTNPSCAFRCLAFTAVLVGALVISEPVNASQVVPLTLTETIRQAQTVVVGNVVAKKTRWGTEAQRWMLTDYTFEVEEVVVAGEGTLPIGRTIVVTYWGGTLGDETQEVADARLPEVGERLLLMLKPEWQTKVHFTPGRWI